ncbi:hypothetical protein TNCV_4625301 [Trichonephila clavipes]|nr:hypothetical protein TNCV_4625301 [Trichonephila clavipes]
MADSGVTENIWAPLQSQVWGPHVEIYKGPWVAQWLEHRTPDRKAWVRCPMPPNIPRVHMDLHAEIVEVEIEVVSPSIVPSGNFAELNRTVTCMVLKANDRRTSCPCHDEFRGPRFDYVRQKNYWRDLSILNHNHKRKPKLEPRSPNFHSAPREGFETRQIYRASTFLPDMSLAALECKPTCRPRTVTMAT